MNPKNTNATCKKELPGEAAFCREKPAVHTVPSSAQKLPCCLFRINSSKCRDGVN